MFVDQELPLLLEKGYLSDIAEFRNSSNSLVAQLAERGFVYNHQNEIDNESKSPRWDLNPRPKVSAPPSFTKTRAGDYETFAEKRMRESVP